jgi:hypothetical protein
MNDIINLSIEGYKPFEVELTTHDDFLKIKETLSRIGIASKKDNTLFQSCHILHKRGRYFIVHFKEMFALDGKPTEITLNDLARRNTIGFLLEQWKLIKVLNPTYFTDNTVSLSQIKVISYQEKKDWNLVQKYTIGSKKQ